MENGLMYDQPIEKEVDKLNFEHKSVLSFVNSGSKVLEIGCHTGYFSYWLKEKGCSVTGVDIYQPALEKALPYLSDSFVGNVENDTFFQFLEGKKFDSIVIMHVLEHLIQPEVLLSKLKECLSENGNIVFVVPNISAWNSRLNILKGNFQYTETGLMDKTHLRFFNYFTAQDLVNQAGLNVDSFVGIGESYFSMVPNWKFIWRFNNVSTKMFAQLMKNRPNVLFQSLLFNTTK